MSHLKNKVARRTARLTSVLLAVLMILTVAPIIAFPASAADGSSEFQRVFLLDCGRKYFEVKDIKEIIDWLAEYHYTHIELAFGNDGLRFLLDDMSLDGYDYTSNQITEAIKAGNDAFDSEAKNPTYNPGDTEEWTQDDMDTIIAYAYSKGIGVIPLFNAPGHMYTVVYAMNKLGLGVTYITGVANAGTSPNHPINPTETKATAFVEALFSKYVAYFAGKGCTMFNIGADESGINTNNYAAYAAVVNSHAVIVKEAGMTPMAFNDGIYNPSYTNSSIKFTDGLVISYWDAGGGTKYAQAKDLAETYNYKINSTHNNWYYVLGKNTSEWAGYDAAINNMSTVKCNYVDSNKPYYTTDFGCTLAVWCDNAGVSYSSNSGNIKTLISTFSKSNGDYFTKTNDPIVPVKITATSDTLYVGQMTNISVTNATSATWTVEPADVLELSATSGTQIMVTAKKAGTAKVTATVNGTEYSVDIVVSNDKIIASTTEIMKGNSATLSLASGRTATWSSSNDSVIKLNYASATSTASVAATASNAVQVVAIGEVGDKATVTASDSTGTIATIELTVIAAREIPTGDYVIDLEVGEESKPYEVSDDSDATGGDATIATAEIIPGTTSSKSYKEVTSIESGKTYLIALWRDANYMLTSRTSSSMLGLSGTPSVNAADNAKWVITAVGTTGYTVKNVGNEGYLTIGNGTAGTSSSSVTLTVEYSTTYKCWTLSRTPYNTEYFLNQWGGSEATVAGGWTEGETDSGSRWRIYELVDEAATSTSVKFTGISEGSTTYTVDGKTYVVNVKAPTEEITETLNYNQSFTLPENSHIVENGDKAGTYVTVAGRTVTAGTTDTSGVVIKVDILNDNNKVIKHYIYTFKVTKEDLTNADDFYIQLWVTNVTIQDTKSTNTTSNWTGRAAKYLTIQAQSAYGENGVPLSALVPTEMDRYEYDGTYWINEQSDKKPVTKLALFKGMALGSSYRQYVWSADRSNESSGIEFEYVRYYSGKWEVSSDRKNWTEISSVKDDPSETGYQVIAYYMVRTQITDEVTTDAADWEKDTSTSDSDITTSSFVALDFAVRYPSGSRSPSTFPQSNKTYLYHCKSGDAAVVTSGNYRYRKLNNFRGMENTSGYEIYMITVTMTSSSPSSTISYKATTGYSYDYSTEQIVWAIDETTKNESGFDKYVSISGSDSVYSGCAIGGDPYVRGVEIYNQHGALITYYIRLKEIPQDTLEVIYVDASANNYQFYSYNIVVDSGTYFNDNIGLDANGAVVNGNVKNRTGATETVTSDLSNMYDIPAKYRRARKYTCIKLEKTEYDQTTGKSIKVITLYYTFENSVSFVIDFGLSLNITLEDIASSLKDATITKIEITPDNEWADIKANGTSGLTYTPKCILPGSDRFTVKVTGEIDGKEDYNEYFVTIVPASTVYYEDDFIKYTEGDGWTEEGTSSGTQSTDVIGSKNPYGYDGAYVGNNNFSMGSYHWVTVNKDKKTASASFTFTGTGFDLISATGKDTGAIFIDILNNDTGDVTKLFVDTYYGYVYGVDETNPWLKCVWTYTYDSDGKNGKWHVTRKPVKAKDGESGEFPATPTAGQEVTTYEPNYTWSVTEGDSTLYQIPVISVTDLEHGSYTVTITARYNAFFDHANKKAFKVCIDGVRIYNTLADSSVYAPDAENDPDFTEVRDIIISADDFGKNGTDAGAVFIDGFETTGTVDDFKKFGPNNEVYLAKGQGIAFNISIPTGARIFIGAKSPNGSATLYINGEEFKVISTATDMYYDITGLINKDGTNVISNKGDGILSITTIKVTNGTATFTVSAQTISEARVMLLNMIQPEVPVFTPERFEASWSTVTLFRNSVHALMVRTSTDVDHITVDGKEITNFYYAAAFEGWGRNRKLVKYKVFTLFLGNDANIGDYEVVAFDADGVASEAHIATLTGKTGVGKFN